MEVFKIIMGVFLLVMSIALAVEIKIALREVGIWRMFSGVLDETPIILGFMIAFSFIFLIW